jgi:hypothetical protein
MFWESNIAKQMIAETSASWLVQTGWIIFNWFNLLDCWEIVAEGNYDDINWVQIDTYKIPREDGNWLLWYYINGKQINFKLIIKEDTEEALNIKIDEVKKKLTKKDWELKIRVNGEYRTQKAYLSNMEFNRDWEKKTIQNNISFWFTLLDHFYSDAGTVVTEFNVTWNKAFDLENKGTASCFFKAVMIFWNSNAWVNMVRIDKDWYFLQTNTSISNWSVLIIDGVNKEVTLNGNSIDYDWVFVEMQTWSNPLQISINWVHNVDITILYNEMYL